MDDVSKEFVMRLTVEPMNIDVRLKFANHLLAIGDVDSARIQFEIVSKLAPEDTNALQGLKLTQHSFVKSETASEVPVSTIFESPKQDTKKNLHLVPEPQKPNDSNVVEFSGRRGSITFNDIVGMDQLKNTVRLKIVEPFQNPKLYAKYGKRSGGGVLLYGPPGCGKTLLGKAIATECKAEFIHVDIADILNMYVGQSENNIRNIFVNARLQAPTVLFFDEFDALALSRSKSNSDYTRTIVNELLSQLDGLSSDNEKILIMAATNMPWDIDTAVKRPGRFSRHVFIPPPDQTARQEMMLRKIRSMPHEEFSLSRIIERTNFCSGADLEGIMDDARERVIADILSTGLERPLTEQDILQSIEVFPPSTLEWLRTAQNLVRYGGSHPEYREVAEYLISNKL